MLKFLVALVTVALLIAVSVFLLAEYQLIRWPGFFRGIIAYAFFSTLIIYSFLYKINQPETFVRLYLLSMVVKLLGGAIFILILIVKDRNNVMANSALFLIAYILFTAVEVGFLYTRNTPNR